MSRGEDFDATTSESVNERMIRLYLDIDGVVYPIKSLGDSYGIDESDVDMLHEREWWHKSLVKRLGSMGVDIVMASSWGRMFLGSVIYSPKEVIGATRALYIDSKMPKVEAVKQDLINDPAPFIWIDDDLTPDMIDQVRAAIPENTPGLYVKTHSDQGLTNQELDAIEELFIKQL